MERKSQDILKAIASGRSCEQILARDGTLTYHDIFHVVTETPTSFWRKTSASPVDKGRPGDAALVRPAVRHRRD